MSGFGLGFHRICFDKRRTKLWKSILFLRYVLIKSCILSIKIDINRTRSITTILIDTFTITFFPALFPYVILFVLLIRAVTLPGAMNGIIFFIRPQWGKLLDPNVNIIKINFNLKNGINNSILIYLIKIKLHWTRLVGLVCSHNAMLFLISCLLW